MRSSRQGKTVLVVEDDHDARRLIESRLARSGLRVVSAGSGEEAIDLAVAHHPDVITMDVGLGGIDGLEVVRRLLDVESTRSIPVIFITGHVPSRLVEAAPLASGRYILRKPYDPRVLLLAVDQALNCTAGAEAGGRRTRTGVGQASAVLETREHAVETGQFSGHHRQSCEAPSQLNPRSIAEDVAHDARSLLFVITEITHAMMAESQHAPDADHVELARLIRDRTADLIGLCDMLVTGVDLCERPLLPQAERVSMERLLREVVPDIRRHMRRKNGTLNLKLRRDLPDIVCDVELMRITILSLFLSIASSAGQETLLRVRAGACRLGAGRGVRLTLAAHCRAQDRPRTEPWHASLSERIAASAKYQLAERLSWTCGGRLCISGRPQALVATLIIPSPE